MSTWGQIQQQLRHPSNPVVFFDITIGNTEIGRMKMELFSDVVPKTAENFRYELTDLADDYKLVLTLIFNSAQAILYRRVQERWCTNWL